VKIARIGMDTSKHVFQLHGVDATESVVLRRRFLLRPRQQFADAPVAWFVTALHTAWGRLLNMPWAAMRQDQNMESCNRLAGWSLRP